MDDTEFSHRVFPFQLASWLPHRYTSYLHWLRHLLERLGPDSATAIWQEVSQDYDAALLLQILSAGWAEAAQDEALDLEAAIAAALARYFPRPIQGVSPDAARELVERMPPIRQIRQAFSSPNRVKLTTAYEALHLRMDGPALLAEALIRRHGKQGELIVYDLLRQERIESEGGATGSVAEFILDFIAEPAEANLFTAGLEVEVVQASECEATLHVRRCAWADYFRERHPQVGYLMACSTDEAAYRAFNPSLRMQRLATLMEGGPFCDFHIFAT